MFALYTRIPFVRTLVRARTHARTARGVRGNENVQKGYREKRKKRKDENEEKSVEKIGEKEMKETRHERTNERTNEQASERRRPMAHRDESSWSPLRATLPPLVLSSRDPHATAIDNRVARGPRGP